MKKLILLSFLFASILSIQAQSIFSPIPSRVKLAIDNKPVVVDNLKLSLIGDSTASLFSLTATTTALSYEIGGNSTGKLLNGAGLGISKATFKMINGKAVPIWDISALFMTSVKITDMTFTGAGGMIAIGFNPGYLVGIGGNLVIREGVAYIGTQAFQNGKWYLCTSIGINL